MSIPPPASRPVQSAGEELRLSLFGSATSVPPPPPPQTSSVLQGEAFPPAPPYQHFAASLGSSSPASGYDHSSSSHDVHTHLLRSFNNLQHAPHASRAITVSINKLGISFALINAGVYFIQICIWIFLWLHDQNQNNGALQFVGMIFIAAIYFVATLCFLLYGGRLFVMLKQVPYKSNGRNRKLFEVGIVMGICVTCSIIRCLLAYLSAFDADASLDILDQPMMNPYYYLLVEILPSVSLLFILRKFAPEKIVSK